MTERVRNVRFLSWDEACRFVEEKGVLNEIKEAYFRYAGFASLEMGEKSYERVHVNGFVRIYPADLNDLRGGMPIVCNSAMVNQFMAINGSFNDFQREKFVVFDDEVVISGGKGETPGDEGIAYPEGIFFNKQDLMNVCQVFGLKAGNVEDVTSQQGLSSERELNLLCMVGVMSYLLSRYKGADSGLTWHHLSDAFIDELFETLASLGVAIDGKNKFEFERLISEALKYLNNQSSMDLEVNQPTGSLLRRQP